MQAAIEKEGATVAIIACKVGGVLDAEGKSHSVDAALSGSPSIMFDAVGVMAGPAGDRELAADPDAVGFLMDAKRHLKAIGVSGVPGLSAKADVSDLPGVVDVGAAKGLATFVTTARGGKVWEREAK